MSDTEQPANVPSDNVDPDTSDPVVRKMPEHQYSKEQLLKLRNSPAAMRKPDVLDDPGLSSILRMVDDNRGGKGPGAGRIDVDKDKGQRRPADRLRSEDEFSGSAVLSPQRPYKSSTWGEGCHVSRNAEKGPGGLPARVHDDLEREAPLQPRRLMPQRPLRPETGDRTAFYQNRDRESLPRDKYGRSEHCDRDRVERDSFANKDRRERGGGYERDNLRGVPARSDFRNGIRDPREKYGRETMDSRKPGERHGPRGGRDQWSHRPYNYQEEDVEPEWMSAGPTSKYDTIELKGFEEEEPRGRGKQEKVKEKEKKEIEKEEEKVEEQTELELKEAKPPAKISRPPSRDEGGPETVVTQEDKTVEPGKLTEEKSENGLGFSLDEFNKLFTLDSLPDVPLGELLEDFGGGLRDEATEGSKFSKFFSAERPSEEPPKAGSLLMKLGLNEEKAEEKGLGKSVDPNQILGEFLKGAQKRGDVPPPPVAAKKVPQKALRLEDLEGGVVTQKREKPEAEMDAFKKLLAQVESKGLTNGGLPTEPTKTLPKSAMTEEEFLSSVIGGTKSKIPPTSQPSLFPGVGVQNDPLARLTTAMHTQQQQQQPLLRPGLMNQPPPMSVAGFPPMMGDHMNPNQHPALQSREAQTLLRALSSGRLSIHDLLKHLNDPRFDRHLASISEQVLQVVAPREYAAYRGQFYGMRDQPHSPLFPPPVIQQKAPQQSKSVYADIPLSVIKRMTANKEAEAVKAKSDAEAQASKGQAQTSSSPTDVSSVAAKPKAPSKLTGRTVSQLPQQAEKLPTKEPEKPSPTPENYPQPRQTTPVFPQRVDNFPKPVHQPPYGSDPRLILPQPTIGRSQSEGLLQKLMSGALQQQQQQQRPAPPQFMPHTHGYPQGYPSAFDIQAKLHAERLPLSKEGLLSQMMGTRGVQPQVNNFFSPQMPGHSGFPMGMFDNLGKSMHK